MSWPPNHEPPTGGWEIPPKPFLGDIDQHWNEADQGLVYMVNTTKMDSMAGCGGGSPVDAFPLPANSDDEEAGFCCRLGADCVGVDGGGTPEGPWPLPQYRLNTYEPSPTGETRDYATCRMRGAFRVVGQKIWQGQPGPRDYAAWGKHRGMKGNCACERLEPVLKPSQTKYLSAVGNGWYQQTGTVDGVLIPYIDGTITGATVAIGRLSGLKSGNTAPAVTLNFDAEYPEAVIATTKAHMAGQLNATAASNYTNARSAYCGWLGFLFNDNSVKAFSDLIVYSGYGLTQSFSLHFDSGRVPMEDEHLPGWTYQLKIDAAATLQLNEGNANWDFHLGAHYYDETGAERVSLRSVRDWTESWTTEDNKISWQKSDLGQSDSGESSYGGIREGYEVTFGTPYTYDQVCADMWAATKTWPFHNRRVCEPRSDDNIPACPLTSYNEVSGATLTFAAEGDVAETKTDGRWPFSLVPAGNILGAPLPDKVLIGGVWKDVAYAPYFDPSWIEYNPEPITVEGGSRYVPLRFGGFSPYRYATQWTDLKFQRNFPNVPFLSYGAIRNRDEVNMPCGTPIILDGGIVTGMVYVEHIMFEKPTHNFARPCGEDRHLMKAGTIRCGTYGGMDGDNIRVLISADDQPFAAGRPVKVCGIGGVDDGFYQVVSAGVGEVILTASFTMPQPPARPTTPAVTTTDSGGSTGGDEPTTGT